MFVKSVIKFHWCTQYKHYTILKKTAKRDTSIIACIARDGARHMHVQQHLRNKLNDTRTNIALLQL